MSKTKDHLIDQINDMKNTQAEIDNAEAIQRAEWLHKNNAPKEWLIFTEAEFRMLKDTISGFKITAEYALKSMEYDKKYLPTHGSYGEEGRNMHEYAVELLKAATEK